MVWWLALILGCGGSEEDTGPRGDDPEIWFDGICIHPNEQGHAQIAEMFFDVVRE